MSEKSLYARLGGYDAIAGRIAATMASRAKDSFSSIFLCHNAGGLLLYTGRDMTTAHKGMRIDQEDWSNDRRHRCHSR